ncbi:MAG: alpha-hydroxy-acid oxidizing protein [Burkholderiales bacterium]|nr:alpha-hydroxy-acid oxidizing protein [Burkholderiales bacterium]
MNAPLFLTLHEFVKKARQKLNQDRWDYIVGGTETETTVRRNRLALDSLAFRPRVLRDVSEIDASTRFLGRKLRLPLVLAPIGGLELFAPEGGAAAAGAAQQFGVSHMLSSVCEPGLEAVAQAAPDALRMFQLYARGDADWVDAMAERAIAAGYGAFCLTVDTAYYSRRERDLAKRHSRSGPMPAREFQARLTWSDVARLKDKFDIPLILKGIATAEDADLALEHGVDAIYVSNHGGRQLDHGRGTMEILPEIAAAVGGRAPILIDGGFNRGADIVKAMAAGADLVGIGRMQCIGLAAGGEAGLVRMLEILEQEIQICLGLLGVNAWAGLDLSYLHPSTPVGTGDTLGAFPLLSLEEKSFY